MTTKGKKSEMKSAPVADESVKVKQSRVRTGIYVKSIDVKENVIDITTSSGIISRYTSKTPFKFEEICPLSSVRHQVYAKAKEKNVKVSYHTSKVDGAENQTRVSLDKEDGNGYTVPSWEKALEKLEEM